MYIQRLASITVYAVITSAILLGLYWTFNHFSIKKRNGSSKFDKLNPKIEKFLKNQPERNREIYRVITLFRTTSSAMLVVAFVNADLKHR